MIQTAEEAKEQQTVWDRERFNREIGAGRTNIHPAHWPEDVNIVSLEGMSFLGMDTKGNLYVNGEQLHTVKRWGTQERLIAWLAVAFTGIAAVAACASAYADIALT